jgi:myosin protein heavy chain
VNARAEQKARLLEARVVENAETIDQLRQERSLLVSDHKELQKRFSEISEVSE